MKLLHYVRIGETTGEYIVLLDIEGKVSKATIRLHSRPGFHLHTLADVEGEKLHQLPTEVELTTQ